MTTIFQLALRHAVAVGEQVRIFRFVGDNFGGEAGQHIRTIQIPGNVTETFRLALGAQGFARLIETFQGSIRRRADFIDDGQGEMFRQSANHQLVIFFFIVAPRLAIHLQGDQRQVFTIQTQRHIGRRRVTGDFALSRNHGFLGIQVKGQIDIANEIIRRTVVVAVFGLGLLCHKKPLACSIKCQTQSIPVV